VYWVLDGGGDKHVEGDGIKPGDRLVELGGLAMTAGAVSGAAASGWIVWRMRDNWLTAIGAVIPGGVLGYVAARIVIEFVYHTADGRTHVARVGKGSLPATIRAGLIGSMTAAVVIAVIGLVLFGASDHVTTLIGIPFGFGILCGVVLGCLSALV
jgi:hypothetical protein